MTDHEMVLLRAAVEEIGLISWLRIWPPERAPWQVVAFEIGTDNVRAMGKGDTLADALTALLRDLGADVPEWPSEEETEALRHEFDAGLTRGLIYEVDLVDLLAARRPRGAS